MNVVTILNVLILSISSSLWLILFFALFERATVLLRLAFVCIPTGGYVTVLMAIGGIAQPTIADLFTNVGVLFGTVWLARRKSDTVAPFARLSRWV